MLSTEEGLLSLLCAGVPAAADEDDSSLGVPRVRAGTSLVSLVIPTAPFQKRSTRRSREWFPTNGHPQDLAVERERNVSSRSIRVCKRVRLISLPNFSLPVSPSVPALPPSPHPSSLPPSAHPPCSYELQLHRACPPSAAAPCAPGQTETRYTGPGHRASLGGLQPHTAYRLRVLAHNEAGSGASEWIGFTTQRERE